jgi:multidrug resistance efflux pump
MVVSRETPFGAMVKYGLPVLSVLSIFLAMASIGANRDTSSLKAPPTLPPRSPFDETVACLGIIEPQTESIDVGSPLPGVVAEVFVQVGQCVKAGEPLFRLDDRQLQAELRVRKAELKSAQVQLDRLKKLPRAEEVPVIKAKVEDAQYAVSSNEDEYQRAVRAGVAIADEARIKAYHNFKRAQMQLASAKAEFALLNAGAWEDDLIVSRESVAKVMAVVQQTETELDRLTVRMPVDGQVLEMHIHRGEYISTAPGRSLLLVGYTQVLHVRVSIDEHEIPRFRLGVPACARVIGNPESSYPLTFVRVEPSVIPKRSLTGDNKERVDTRVLQVIYQLLPPPGASLYVGQQLDVYLRAAEGAND